MRRDNYRALYMVEGLSMTRDDLHPKAAEFEMPCDSCGFCPYGVLVENFPLADERDEYSCPIFGHDCPAFYMGEKPFVEQGKGLDLAGTPSSN